MVWFLDTNVIVACLRGKSSPAMRRLVATSPANIRVPLQVHAELLVGAAKSTNAVEAKKRVFEFLSSFEIALPNLKTADHYVAIRTDLESRGLRISEADIWIAATVIASNGTLVTNNVREFSRIPGLAIEDWTQS